MGLKKKAILVEDELALECGRQYEATGKLNDPGLSDKSIEYENLTLDIIALERLLNELDAGDDSPETEKE